MRLNHQKIHFQGKNHQCEKCGRRYKTKNHKCGDTPSGGAMRRGRKPRTSGEKQYSCHKCNSSFSSKANLTSHMKLHSPDNPHVCSTCYKPFLCAAYLAKHQQVHLGRVPGNAPGYRRVRKYSSGEKVPRQKHERKTQEERQFSCEICNARFWHAQSLKLHSKLHSTYPPIHDLYKSSTPSACQMGFKQSTVATNLRKYIHTHLLHGQGKVTKPYRGASGGNWAANKKKPFPCTACSSSFMLQNTLNKHMKVHSSN